MRLLSYILRVALICTPCYGFNAASAEENAKQALVIASFSFPPLLHLADDNSFSGTMGETVKAICEEAEIACSFKVVPLARAYSELKQGRVDALVTLDLGQFKDCCLVSDWHAGWSAGLFSTSAYNDIPSVEQEMLGRELIVVNGMRSPYSFLPRLDQMAEGEEIKLYKAKDVETAVLMFARDRAGLLWGGEDFRWYLHQVAPTKQYSYRPLFHKEVVLWVRKQKSKILDAFNAGYERLIEDKVIEEGGLLNPPLMKRRYKDHILY